MIDFRETVEWLKEDGFCDAAAIGFGEKTAVTALFPYRLERPTAVSAAASYIDPFALRNNYREMAARLKTAAVKIRKAAGLNKSEVRIFVNSSLPEKAAAAFAGIGFRGKSSLLISPLYGVNTLIGGIMISLPAGDLPRFDGERHFPAESAQAARCGACRACIDACPVGAIGGNGVDRSRCLQSLASCSGPLPPELLSHWDILYGCSRCRDACPYSRFNLGGVAHHRGEIDESETIGEWLQTAAESEEAFCARFKGTALAMSWIDKRALLRNVVILSRRLGIFNEETERVCRQYKNEFSQLLSVDIPPLLR